MCCYVSGMFICECSRFSRVAPVAYSYSVTYSCVVAAALLWWDEDSQSRNTPKWRSLMRIDKEPHYAMMLSAVLQQRCWNIMFFKLSHNTSLKASFVATVSTEHYRFVFGLSGGLLCAGLFSDWLLLSSTHSIITILLPWGYKYMTLSEIQCTVYYKQPHSYGLEKPVYNNDITNKKDSRVSHSYLATSNNRMLVHRDWAMQIPGYATEMKAESTVSGDWKMKLEHQSLLALEAISITVRNIR